MKFDEYISNPMGKKNAVFGNREMYRELYIDKLDKILLREIGKVKYQLYYKVDEFYIHFKIPSETVNNFYYDTVIMFYGVKNVHVISRKLDNYHVKFYSNDPSFVYTFAHSFIKNNLFIDDLVSKMSKEAIKKAAVEKNPRNEVGYVKSIYFAYLLAKRYGLFNKVQYEVLGKKYNKKELLSDIIHADEMIEMRRVKEEEQKENKRREKQRKEYERINDINRSRRNIDIQTKTVSRTNVSKRTSSSKRAKRI